jgi:16S rRNA (cytosine1402-N4)-methyltransferase
MPEPAHVPVMPERAVELLVTDPSGVYWDATVGAAGHARRILERLAGGGKLICSDRDPNALALAEASLDASAVTFVAAKFSELANVWRKISMERLNGILFDFGIGSFQLAAERGLSFDVDGPLDMRMGGTDTPLDVWLNRAPEREIADIIFRYGEERHARKIARSIVRSRPIHFTFALRDAVASVTPAVGRVKTWARVFQAFRIFVNDELNEIAKGLASTEETVGPNGRIVAISYHSLEDRAVKDFFRREAKGCVCPPDLLACACGHKAWLRILTRRPETPTSHEIESNSRARSAKLRAAEHL